MFVVNGGVGFTGLGAMGGAIAFRLVRATRRLTVFDLRPEAVGPLTAAGAASAGSPAAAADGAEVVFTSLPAARQLEDVLLGPGGIATAARPSPLLVNLSTIGPAAARDLAEKSARRGITLLDAPVGGGQAEAEQGTLVVMGGGPPEAFEQCRELLELIGSPVFHLGSVGSGQAAKLALNLAYGALVAGASEATALARALGADLESFAEILAAVDCNAWFRRPAQDALADSFEPGFRVDLELKDLRLALEAARQADVSLPVGERVHDAFARADAPGLGDRHTSALVELYR
jgi:3-hydroxyisobutyrate dehydrogenase-like beta-hydroxyacid dehydrogenase